MAKKFRCPSCRVKASPETIARLEEKGKIKRGRCGGPICPRCKIVCMDPDCSGYATKDEKVQNASKT